jgi:hypothetical protein
VFDVHGWLIAVGGVVVSHAEIVGNVQWDMAGIPSNKPDGVANPMLVITIVLIEGFHGLASLHSADVWFRIHVDYYTRILTQRGLT